MKIIGEDKFIEYLVELYSGEPLTINEAHDRNELVRRVEAAGFVVVDRRVAVRESEVRDFVRAVLGDGKREVQIDYYMQKLLARQT